eukprot:TRINITY_DN7952_c0_g1_i4.p1 TRINITY_DN7952_c0_g1~~TRINITY_DN7952_c0_g1_i4.p1  ORF type:complete len:501 (+),score=92.87 TRINITY_DN7952_c0_g1_i4:144-1646(+)
MPAPTLPDEPLNAGDDIQDPWVLIFIGVAWFAMVVTWLRAGRGFHITEAGVFVRSTSKKLPENDDMRFLFSEKGVYRTRSFAGFCRGDELPPKSAGAFQHGYTTASRAVVYKSMREGAFQRCWRFVCCSGLLAMSLTFLARNATALENKLSGVSPGVASLFQRQAIFENMYAAAEVHKFISPLAAFMLALYVNGKIGYFFHVVELCWGIQGKIHDIALAVAGAFPDRTIEEKRVFFRIYRYLNAVHFLTYLPLAEKFDGLSMDDLVSCGLITNEEKLLLDRAAAPRASIMLWLAAEMNKFDRSKVDTAVREHLVDALDGLRGKISLLTKELTRVYPLSFAQLIQLMIDALLMLTAPSLAYSMDTQRKGVLVYIWPALGSMFIALFFQGCMRLITSIEYPFGYELDDLDAEWLLLATERETYSYFTEAMPSNDSDVIRVQPAPSREGPKGFAAGSAVEEVALGVMNGVQCCLFGSMRRTCESGAQEAGHNHREREAGSRPQ